jgi:hypothetical protein
MSSARDILRVPIDGKTDTCDYSISRAELSFVALSDNVWADGREWRLLYQHSRLQTNISSLLHFLFGVILHFCLCFVYDWRRVLHHAIMTSQSTAFISLIPSKYIHVYIILRKTTFSIIKQIVHVVEGKIKKFHPSNLGLYTSVDNGFLGVKISTTWAI